ncbi:hypothetical protein K6Y76_34980 [Burkholderia cenocepacia]|uniref:hypothetical protein n=1 Tax=Burkholderia cepacia complex TaxID=87882 RepID=UPI000F5B202C|nr:MULTISPECIES: hypothetical protein [Burkholderia cepacia complex]MCG0576882.1 hypothetical protein [Burkholderia cenocepacia]MCW3523438.1 hypothetical protein [Burkholderia cenocepacia]MCW3618253.1 hypothetical protein [Burkholderia cenocepacia]MCW3656094.1 hypothetical protein [Burkholderia cenocepacia]MCW3665029.1 hypothetical protein [Burkholderia cenocepacia]
MPKHFNVRPHRLDGIAIDVSVDVFSERFINLLMSLAGHASRRVAMRCAVTEELVMTRMCRNGSSTHRGETVCQSCRDKDGTVALQMIVPNG